MTKATKAKLAKAIKLNTPAVGTEPAPMGGYDWFGKYDAGTERLFNKRGIR